MSRTRHIIVFSSVTCVVIMVLVVQFIRSSTPVPASSAGSAAPTRAAVSPAVVTKTPGCVVGTADVIVTVRLLGVDPVDIPGTATFNLVSGRWEVVAQHEATVYRVELARKTLAIIASTAQSEGEGVPSTPANINAVGFPKGLPCTTQPV